MEVKQMQWRSALGGGAKILHLRTSSYGPWLSYHAFPGLSVPDLQLGGLEHGQVSKGWTTYQKLLKAGWELLPSPKEE